MWKSTNLNRYIILSLVGALGLPISGQAAEVSKAVVDTKPAQVESITTNAPVKPVEKAPVRYVEPELQRGQEISRVTGDVDGDGQEEVVLLMGNPVVERSNFMGDLYVVCKEPKTDKVKGFFRPKDMGGYNAYLALTDVTGNGVPDVLVAATTGGSGGIIDYRIVDFSEGKAEEIFTKENNQGITVQGEFLPQYKVELNFPSLHKELLFDLQGDKDMYKRLNVYDSEGQVVYSGLRPYAHNLSGLITLDLDGDGADEVITTQRVVGANNTDTLGYVRTIWDYRVGSWQPRETSLKMVVYAKQTYGKEHNVLGDSGYEISKLFSAIEGSNVTYPHFAKMGTGTQQWKINSCLEAYVRDLVEKVRTIGSLELNYEVKYAGQNYASILFTGVKTERGKAVPVVKGFNFNVKTGAQVPLNMLIPNEGEFWKVVKAESGKKNISVTKEEVTSYYFDGAVLGLLYKDNKEFDINKGKLTMLLAKNKLGEKFLTNQSEEVKPLKKAKK